MGYVFHTPEYCRQRPSLNNLLMSTVWKGPVSCTKHLCPLSGRKVQLIPIIYTKRFILYQAGKIFRQRLLKHSCTHSSVRCACTMKWILQLRVCPRNHRAVVLHAISPISMKLCQFKGSTPTLKKTNWFPFWFFLGGDRPNPRFFLVFTRKSLQNR